MRVNSAYNRLIWRHDCILYTCVVQIQGIKRFACQTRLLQTQNAFKRGAKRVYYKRKTRVNAEQNAFTRDAKRPRARILRKVTKLLGRSYIVCIVDMTQGRGLNRRQALGRINLPAH